MIQIRPSGHRLANYKFRLLLLILFLFLAVEPFFAGKPAWIFVFNALLFFMLIGNIYVLRLRRHSLLFGTILAIGAEAMFGYADIADEQSMEVFGFLLLGVFWLYTTVVILGHVLSRQVVTLDTLAGAVCVYLQLGLIWAIGFFFIETFIPGSFSFTADPLTGGGRSRDDFRLFTYYSFVTLTSLGYGDMVSLSAPARNLSFLEVAFGQVYLAVLVARLLGLHLASTGAQETEVTDGKDQEQIRKRPP
jgi:hypothetical protein